MIAEAEKQNMEEKTRAKSCSGCTVFIVLAFITIIIIAIMIPSYLSSRYRREFLECKTNLINIGTAVEMYHARYNKYPQELKEISPDFITSIPSCPVAKTNTYSSGYIYRNNPQDEESAFTVYCNGHYHQKARIPAGYPQFSSKNGIQTGEY
ncbi:MAG: hypothetical protein ACLFQV_04175 [Vulcanimicrobiota bacterium]